MKKRIVIFTLIFLSIFLFIGCGEAKVNTNELNEQVNGLLENLPDDKEENIIVDEIEKNNSLDLEEYEEQLNILKENGEITYEEKQDLLYAQKYILKTSEEVIYPELNFTFSAYSTKNVPSEINLYGVDWGVQCYEPCYTSLGLENPALIMMTTLLYRNDNEEEHNEINEQFKTLMKQLKSDFGEIIAGENYNIFDLDQFSEENPISIMVFEALDCYIVVEASYSEISKDSSILEGYTGTENFEGAKGVDLIVYYTSKNLYHDYYGDDIFFLKYIETYANGTFKYYVEDKNTQGGYYLIDRTKPARVNIY